MPITPHANVETVLKRSSSHSQFAMILVVVWSVNGDGIVLLLPRLVPNDDSYRCVCADNCVVHPNK